MSLAFEKPAIYVITKGAATAANYETSSSEILNIVSLAVEEKVAFVQLREKDLPTKLLFRLAAKAADITGGSTTQLLINDRADVAIASGADGVHLTSRSLSSKVIRESFPIDLTIGVSVHSLEAAKMAANDGADFAVFGPIFETPGKGEPRGLEKLKDICLALPGFPIFGLGGIDGTNYNDVLNAGASGFGAIRFLNDARGVRAVSAKFLC